MIALSAVPSSVASADFDLDDVLAELNAVAREKSGWQVRRLRAEQDAPGQGLELMALTFRGPPNPGIEPLRIGLFAGVHGDEPAGTAACLELARQVTAEPALADGYELFFYPCCNPEGMRRGCRGNGAGLDLNREFWRGSAQPEVQILEAELRRWSFDGVVALHADDTCDGIYGYTHGRTLNEALLEPALAAAEVVIPRSSQAVIDGFRACKGHISQCFNGVLSAPPSQSPQPFDLIFETPAGAPLPKQIQATVLALGSILAEYRGFIAQAANL